MDLNKASVAFNILMNSYLNRFPVYFSLNIMFTMSEADTGANSSETTVKIDLSNYALTSETASKVDLEAL